MRETSIHEDLFASDDEEFAEVASQMDVSVSQNQNGPINWGVWASQESSDENSFEHFASQLTDSQLNGITEVDVGDIQEVEQVGVTSVTSPVRKSMQTLEL